MAIAAIVILLTVALSTRLSADLTLLPVGAVVMVTFATWLSERNLRTALAWTWNGYEDARRNQRIARERAGELQRTLKALDEASYRLERANYMLALARDQAEEARRLKQQFAQTISHELRTPLNLIVGFTELMAETPDYYGVSLTPTYLRDLSTVYRNARHLQNLVTDVLDLARIEAAQMGMEPVQTDPAALIHEAMDTIRGLVEARGLALEADLGPDLPALWIDPVRVRQVLLNLIGNAVRFTHAGSITVSARARQQDVVFAVRDTGIGIAPNDQKRIFDDFQQADGSTRRAHEGAGLGLAISKRFVELHGGRIWLRSDVGVGSTFYFSIPIEHPAWQDSLEAQLDQALADHSSAAESDEDPILLLVTRSTSAAGLLTRYVHGCHVVTITELSEARSVAQQLLPQVVVIDTTSGDLPEADLPTIAASWDLVDTHFVAVPLPGEESLLRRLAVQGYLIKPVSRDSLSTTMRRFGEDIDRVLLVDDDRDFVRLMTRLLEENLLRPYHVSSAYNGQQALESIRTRHPDLLLLDLGLPDADGREIIRQIRSDPALKDLPIVVVSAQESVDYQERMAGSITATRAEGLLPSEAVRWVQGVVDTALARSDP